MLYVYNYLIFDVYAYYIRNMQVISLCSDDCDCNQCKLNSSTYYECICFVENINKNTYRTI